MSISTKRSKIFCSKCSKHFRTKGGLNIHIKSHYPDQFQLQCHYCEFTSFQKGNLSKHISSIHKRTLSGEMVSQEISCPICPTKFSTDLQIKSHILRKHTAEKDHKCQHCSYTSVDKTDLRKHIRICHTNDRPYSCETCGYQSHTSSGISRHRRSHIQAKPFKCSVCGMDYADKKRLRDHLMKHSNEKPYACSSCEYRTRRNDNLKTHVRRCHSAADYSVTATFNGPCDGTNISQLNFMNGS